MPDALASFESLALTCVARRYGNSHIVEITIEQKYFLEAVSALVADGVVDYHRM